MRQDDREGRQVPATLSSDTAHSGARDSVMTVEDERIAGALADGLGRWREPRPGFQQQLESRLLERLAEPPRPWWRRLGPARRQARRSAPLLARLPAGSLWGLAAAAAPALTAASLSLPLAGTPEVSAREILDKVQANSENP